MTDEQIVKDDWNTILGELDDIIRETYLLSKMAMGDKDSFEEEEFPALIHFISEIKKEKKNKSWEKLNNFHKKALDNLQFLDETQQIKMQGKRIDRSFIGKLPKNTETLGTMAIEILGDIPEVIKTINDSVEALLIDIKLKLGFSTAKFNTEILDIKHQIELLDDEIKAHSKTKKSRKDEEIIYTQAYRETYHEILEKAIDYITRDFRTHSKTFEHVYERYIAKIKNYKESPAFDDFIKEQCNEIEKAAKTWITKGFAAFNKAQKHVSKIEERLSDTKQSFIKQIKAEFEKEISDLESTLEQLKSLETELESEQIETMKAASERIVSASKFLVRTVDVVSEDPHDRLINDEKIVSEAKKLATTIFNGTYGLYEEKINKYIKLIKPSKNSKKYLEIIKTTKENSLEPNTLEDVLDIIPNLLNYETTIDKLLKELAADIMNIQDKFIKKIKNINKYLGKSDAVEIPAKESLIQIEKANLDDTKTLEKLSKILKKGISQAAEAIAESEQKISEGLGISINPKLEGKISRYTRPTYKPSVKQANKAMKDLEKFAKNLAKDTGNSIDDFVKSLRKFSVQSTALNTFKKLLKKIGKEAKSNKINLPQITLRLEQVVTEYSKLLEEVITTNADDLSVIMKDMDKVEIYDKMDLENFDLKHDELINNISLESVAKEQEKEDEELVCKKCGGKIISRREDYNDMLGLNVLLVKCENNHEDNIIGFGDDDQEEEVIEIKCKKCGSETLLPMAIDLFSKDELTVTATCPKNHKTKFDIKKK